MSRTPQTFVCPLRTITTFHTEMSVAAGWLHITLPGANPLALATTAAPGLLHAVVTELTLTTAEATEEVLVVVLREGDSSASVGAPPEHVLALHCGHLFDEAAGADRNLGKGIVGIRLVKSEIGATDVDEITGLALDGSHRHHTTPAHGLVDMLESVLADAVGVLPEAHDHGGLVLDDTGDLALPAHLHEEGAEAPRAFLLSMILSLATIEKALRKSQDLLGGAQERLLRMAVTCE